MGKGKTLNPDVVREIRRIILSYDEDTVAYRSELLWLRYIRQVQAISQVLPEKGNVLDIGCGMGHLTAMLSSLNPNNEFIGGDLQKAPSWVQFAQYRSSYLVCNALALPFRNAFDVITVFGAMEHTNDDAEFLREIHGALKPGGLVIILNLPNKWSLSEFGADRMGMWTHENKYTRGYINRLFGDASLDIKSADTEFFVPSQVARINTKMDVFFNKRYRGIDKLDTAISRSPLKYFCESWRILAQKSPDSQ